MTSGKVSSASRNRIVAAIPWMVAAVALIFYLLTLNRWVSLVSLPHVAKVAGLTWQPEYFGAAYYLASFPIRWLPAPWIPVGLNLFSAVCAALALTLLARTVILLPHDRTQDQRDRETHPNGLLNIPLAWLPPVLAAVVCGLQMTFWEHGTNGTPEMFELLLFAYVIRCLLEYRLTQKESWLYRAAFVQAAGMTGNFAMVGFSPLFLIAVIWLRGFSFFHLRFLGRLFFYGLAGLSLLFLFPILASFSKHQHVGFWEALGENFKLQRMILGGITFNKAKLVHGIQGDDTAPLWILGLPSLLPLLLLAVRWPSTFGDTSQLGASLTKWVLHIGHGFLLIFCIWVSFDSPVSPRHIMSQNAWQNVFPMLTFYYLGALSVGYFSGYFLLVFRAAAARGRRPKPAVKFLNTLAVGSIAALLFVTSVGLFFRNIREIRISNGPMVRAFAEALAGGLPARGVILSDDSRRLDLVQLYLAKFGRQADFLSLNAQALYSPFYHRYLRSQHSGKWAGIGDEETRTVPYEDPDLARWLMNFAKDTELSYLHPSFGFYFEFFRDEPHGLVHRLKLAERDALLPQPLSSQLIAENENFWTHASDHAMKPVFAALASPSPTKTISMARRLYLKTHLPQEENAQAKTLGGLYSHSLDHWGVELQKAGKFELAGTRFEQALLMNPDNVVAQVNRDYNKNYRAGNRGVVKLSQSVEDLFGKYRSWDQVLGENGPYDEPSLSYAQGYVFHRNRQLRQAALFYDRAQKLAPTDLNSRLSLAQVHLLAGLPDKALAYMQELRSQPDVFPIVATNISEIINIEASALFAKSDPQKATNLIEVELARDANNMSLMMTATRLYVDNGLFGHARKVVDDRLKLFPDDSILLVNKSVIAGAQTNYVEAIELLSRVLKLHPDIPTARLYRAMFYLRVDRLDEAKDDYAILLKQFPAWGEPKYGLHEIAYRKHEADEAIRYATAYLTNAIPQSTETKLIQTRLRELKGEPAGSPPQADKSPQR